MWEYRASVLSVVDGDTLRTLWDQGRHTYGQEDVRLLDVWAPELREPGGPETKEFVSSWCAEAARANFPLTLRWPILIHTEINSLVEPEEKRTFTRYVADVWFIDKSRHLNADVRTFLLSHPEWGKGA